MPAESRLLPDEGSRPKDNHLALMTGEGSAIAIPPGATLIFVTGKTAEDVYPAILVKVDKKKLIFQCGCRKPGCNRQFHWRITHATGSHPSRG